MSKLITKVRELYHASNQQSFVEIAKRIGVSRTTLYSLFNDDWKQIQRETIEKVCDFFHCDVSELFEIQEEPFWTSVKTVGEVCFIFGGTLAGKEEKSYIGQWDIKVMHSFTEHLNRMSGKQRINIFSKTSLEFGKDLQTIIEFIKTHNTIIIGSPKANRITELVLAKLYGAEPFNPSSDNREKIPYRFVRPQEWGESKLESAVTEISANGKLRGIFSQKSKQVIAFSEYFDDFFNRRIEHGRDCGLLVVVNRPFGTTVDVKTIILAGYTGLGSYGMAQLLLKERNNLEPRTSKPLERVAQFEFKKMSPDIDDREVTKMTFVQEK
ncbi:MAG: helix-turn-helix transcriptional regulator [bacterium]|nr:helix-turn-helix transcriptional regulator [bacterium]